MKDLYKVIYKKGNGEIIERERTTLPQAGIGKESSMGWLVLDIKINFQDKWYSLKNELVDYKRAKKLYLKKWA